MHGWHMLLACHFSSLSFEDKPKSMRKSDFRIGEKDTELNACASASACANFTAYCDTLRRPIPSCSGDNCNLSQNNSQVMFAFILFGRFAAIILKYCNSVITLTLCLPWNYALSKCFSNQTWLFNCYFLLLSNIKTHSQLKQGSCHENELNIKIWRWHLKSDCSSDILSQLLKTQEPILLNFNFLIFRIMVERKYPYHTSLGDL